MEKSPTCNCETQADPVGVKGRCWRCNQEGHSGRAQAHIRKVTCAAFNSVCQQCDVIGHYTSVSKRGDKRNKDRIDRDDMSNTYNYGGLHEEVFDRPARP